LSLAGFLIVAIQIFKSSSLEGANFDSASFAYTLIADCDLSKCKGLDTGRHSGPSDVGINTIINSRGKIAESFLRGCGVPEEWITYIPSLIGSQSAIGFYSCFISYSHQDEEFCKRIHARMQQEKLRLWYAPEDLKRGRKIHIEIDRAIRVHDKLLLVLSESSMQSEWVATEISKARMREKTEGKQVLFPIRLCSYQVIKDWTCFDHDTGKDMAREIREYYLPDDFSNWKDHDSFEAGFAKLLRDLKKADDANQ
jgi:hypothetical protein